MSVSQAHGTANAAAETPPQAEDWTDTAEGADSTLTPTYFHSRTMAERFMERFEEEQFKPLLESFSKQFYEKAQEDFMSFLLSDAESNFQGELWRQTDAVIAAMLGGAQWVLAKYVYGSQYDCGEIRKTLAGMVADPVKDLRIADLEAENKKLRADMEWFRSR